jgi:transcription-repair coupling factor (superfamily II helicase)
MDEHELEDVMQQFVSAQADVLISTTIIESGLDIPNANTIIIDRADRFGLADLYQLRGRVGRGQHKAYAYLMLPRDMMTVGEARKRINAIKQYGSLGAGIQNRHARSRDSWRGEHSRHAAKRAHRQHRIRPLLLVVAAGY